MLNPHTVVNAALNTVFAGHKIVKSSKRDVEAVIGDTVPQHVDGQALITGYNYKNGDSKIWDIRSSDEIYMGEDNKTILAIVRHVGDITGLSCCQKRSLNITSGEKSYAQC